MSARERKVFLTGESCFRPVISLIWVRTSSAAAANSALVGFTAAPGGVLSVAAPGLTVGVPDLAGGAVAAGDCCAMARSPKDPQKKTAIAATDNGKTSVCATLWTRIMM